MGISDLFVYLGKAIWERKVAITQWTKKKKKKKPNNRNYST